MKGEEILDNLLEQINNLGLKIEKNCIVKGISENVHKFDILIKDKKTIVIQYINDNSGLGVIATYAKAFDCHIDKVIIIFEEPSDKSLKLAKLYRINAVEANEKTTEQVLHLLRMWLLNNEK
jgi:catabolite regulation protein CreA